MPDGYGNNMDSTLVNVIHRQWTYNPGGHDKSTLLMAHHMRYDHGAPLHLIQKRLGLSRKELKEVLDEN